MRQLDAERAHNMMADAYNAWLARPDKTPEEILAEMVAIYSELPKDLVMNHLIDDDGEPRYLGVSPEGRDAYLQIDPGDFQYLVDVLRGKMCVMN